MEKTPEEIKRGLLESVCDANYALTRKSNDALVRVLSAAVKNISEGYAYLEQLEQDNARKDECIRQLEREKTELLYACEQAGRCLLCKHIAKGTKDYPCRDCRYCDENLTDSYWE